MKAALKAVGIKSYIALINAKYNSEPVDPSFPENGFDHVILCIPQPKDSIWLECTSNTTDFGVLGSFTENRITFSYSVHFWRRGMGCRSVHYILPPVPRDLAEGQVVIAAFKKHGGVPGGFWGTGIFGISEPDTGNNRTGP